MFEIRVALLVFNYTAKCTPCSFNLPLKCIKSLLIVLVALARMLNAITLPLGLNIRNRVKWSLGNGPIKNIMCSREIYIQYARMAVDTP